MTTGKILLLRFLWNSIDGGAGGGGCVGKCGVRVCG